MAAQTYQRGWLDTRTRVQNVFKEDVLAKSLMSRFGTFYVDIHDLTEMEASKWALLLTFGAYAIREEPMPNMNHVKAVAIGELIAPMLPVAYFLPELAANTKIKSIMKHYLNTETPLNRGKTKQGFLNIHNGLAEENRGEDWERIDDDIADEDFLAHHGETYAEFLLLETTMDQNMKPLDLFTTVYIAVAKRGNVTSDFLEKITTGMLDDLQFMATLDVDVISLVYRLYGGYINASNAQGVLDHWLNDIPDIALRVRLTLQQATCSGLTALVTVGRAMRKYPDFDWAKLDVLTGGELTNFRTAVGLVNGNQYFGFNSTLGAARSTLYSSLAYVAKELLIGLNGEVSLKKYAGWVRAPKNASVIRSMVDNYKTTYTNRVESTDSTQDELL